MSDAIKTRPLSHQGMIWTLALLLLGAVLGAVRLNADLMFIDEWFTLYNSGGVPYGDLDLQGIWARVSSEDPGGVGMLYYTSIALWQDFIGSSPFALRALSWLWGVLSMALFARLTRMMAGEQVSLWALMLLGASAFYADYFHEARAYTLLVLLSAGIIGLYYRLAYQNRGSWAALAGLALLSAGLLYTHYLGLALLGAVGLVHLWRYPRSDKRAWALTLAALMLGIAAYTPWVNVALLVIADGAQDAQRQAYAMDAQQTFHALLHTFANGSAGLGLLLIGWGTWTRHKAGSYAVALLVPALAAILIVNALIPFMIHPRYLLLLLPLLALLGGIGLGAITPRPLRWMLATVWVMSALWHSATPDFIQNLNGAIWRYPAQGVRASLGWLEGHQKAPATLIWHHDTPQFAGDIDYPYSYQFLRPPLAHAEARWFEAPSATYHTAGQALDEHFAPVMWLMTVGQAQRPFQRGSLPDRLWLEYAECGQVYETDGAGIWAYLSRDSQAGLTHVEAQTTPLSLFPASISARPDKLEILWGMYALADVPVGTYSLGWHVFDAEGQFVAQTDISLPDERDNLVCLWSDIAIDHLPPGDYVLRLVIYDWQSQERLLLAEGASQPAPSFDVYQFTRG